MTIRGEEFVDDVNTTKHRRTLYGGEKIYKKNNKVLTSICVSLKVDSISRLNAFPKKNNKKVEYRVKQFLYSDINNEFDECKQRTRYFNLEAVKQEDITGTFIY